MARTPTLLRALLATAALAASALPALAAPPTTIAPVPHVATIGGAKVTYKASFDTYAVTGLAQTPGGTVTTIAYVRDGGDARRPVVFAFNGGPGGASAPLNVGLLGPERIDLPADTAAKVAPHYPLVPNGDSILDVADIVMVDPVGTGFARLTDPAAADNLYSVTGDAAAVAQAIQAWSRAHGRLASPKYILGESYGGVRSVQTAADLIKQSDEGQTLKGVIMLSQSLPVLDTVQRRSNLVGQVVGLPTLAATAWFHKLAGQGETLPAFVQRAEAFGTQEWLPALFAGAGLAPEKKAAVARGLSSFTGVPERYFLDHDLYLSKEEYRRLALADKGLILGLYDTRYTGPLNPGKDPSNALEDAISAAPADLLKSELGIADASDYVTQAHIRNWIYLRQPFATTNGNEYRQLDYVADLLKLMADRKDLRIMVVGGYFDTAASAGADDYLLSRPGLDLSRVTAQHFVGGHMFYTNPESRTLFAGQLRAFITAAH